MTTKVKFMKGNAESQLLHMLGVPYGILRVDGYDPVLIDDHDGAIAWLNELVKANLVTVDEALAMETAVVEAKLESSAATFKKARDFQIPFGFSPTCDFKVCAGANCAHPNPLVHGHIYDENNENVTEGIISTLGEGFGLCADLAQLGGNNKLDAVKLFQQMVESGLPVNDAEWQKRYDALPEETRRQAEEAAAKKSADKILVIIMNRPPREEN